MTVSSTITIKQATELATSDPTQLPEIHEVLSRRIMRELRMNKVLTGKARRAQVWIIKHPLASHRPLTLMVAGTPHAVLARPDVAPTPKLPKAAPKYAPEVTAQLKAAFDAAFAAPLPGEYPRAAGRRAYNARKLELGVV